MKIQALVLEATYIYFYHHVGKDGKIKGSYFQSLSGMG